MKYFHCFINLVFLSSCATTHSGFKAVEVSDMRGPLVVSDHVVTSLSNKSHVSIDFTFENKGGDCFKVESIDFQNGARELPYRIIAGRDLSNCREAMQASSSFEFPLISRSLFFSFSGAVYGHLFRS